MKYIFKKHNLWLLAVLASAGVMVLIICFSAQSAEESDDLSEGIASKILELAQILEPDMTLEELNFSLRKLAHFTLYFILGCSLSGVFNGQKKISPILGAILIGAVFAVSDELHQMLSDGRNASAWDVMLDTFGVAAGSVLPWTFIKKVREKKSKN